MSSEKDPVVLDGLLDSSDSNKVNEIIKEGKELTQIETFIINRR